MNDTPDWTFIETEGLKVNNLMEYIWQEKSHRPTKTINNPYLHITIKIWERWRVKLTSTLSPFSTFTNQSWFAPGSSLEYKKWALHRINRLIDITEKGSLLPKQQLEDKLQDKVHWIQYFQFQSLCSEKPVQQCLKRQLTDFEMLIKIKEMGAKGMISNIYKILLKFDNTAFDVKITKWSEDCKLSITQECSVPVPVGERGADALQSS